MNAFHFQFESRHSLRSSLSVYLAVRTIPTQVESHVGRRKGEKSGAPRQKFEEGREGRLSVE